jgi:hypothetical protein
VYSLYGVLMPGPLFPPDLVLFPPVIGIYTTIAFAELVTGMGGELGPVDVCLGQGPGWCAAALAIQMSSGTSRLPLAPPRTGRSRTSRPFQCLALGSEPDGPLTTTHVENQLRTALMPPSMGPLALTSAVSRACNPGWTLTWQRPRWGAMAPRPRWQWRTFWTTRFAQVVRSPVAAVRGRLVHILVLLRRLAPPPTGSPPPTPIPFPMAELVNPLLGPRLRKRRWTCMATAVCGGGSGLKLPWEVAARGGPPRPLACRGRRTAVGIP